MIALRDADLFRLELHTRLPFRYGIATMTALPHVFLRLTFEFNGRAQVGVTADHLPPKWFTKDPTRAPAEEIDDMLAVIRRAVSDARTIRAATPFAFWSELYATQAAWAAHNQIPPLLANFGVALVEKALLDAFCRAAGQTFAAALQVNALGLDLGSVRPSLAGSAPRDWLPTAPLSAIFARHTVGLGDPLEESDIAPGERLNDGLPQALDACIRFYGNQHFKLKIDGDLPRDRARLKRIAGILARVCRQGYRFSIDGNESFREVDAFVDYAGALLAEPALAEFWRSLMFFEQPWHREVALSPAIGEIARQWPDRPPIVIDESDATLDSLPRALELGYAGTTHKNCKGIFKGIANACLLAQRRQAGQPARLSGEDLTNIGPVALLQDLAVQAALGCESVERNGHHYFAGLSQFPSAMQEQTLAHHADLYVRSAAGWPRLNIHDGRLSLDSVLRAPFGVAELPALAEGLRIAI
jgi:hypothetical protein